MLAPIGPFTDPTEEIFLPFRILQRVNPYLFVYQNPKKVPQFGAEPPRFFIKYREEGRLVRPKYRQASSRFSLYCFFFLFMSGANQMEPPSPLIS